MRALVQHILGLVSHPILNFLHRWIYDGELEDTYHEVLHLLISTPLTSTYLHMFMYFIQDNNYNNNSCNCSVIFLSLSPSLYAVYPFCSFSPTLFLFFFLLISYLFFSPLYFLSTNMIYSFVYFPSSISYQLLFLFTFLLFFFSGLFTSLFPFYLFSCVYLIFLFLLCFILSSCLFPLSPLSCSHSMS